MKTQNPRILIFHIAKFILYLHERPCFPYRNNTNRRLYISLNVLSLHQKKTAVKIMSLFLLQKLLSSLHHKTVNILFTFRFWPDVLRHRNDSQSWAPKQNFQSNNVQGLLLGVCPPNLWCRVYERRVYERRHLIWADPPVRILLLFSFIRLY